MLVARAIGIPFIPSNDCSKALVVYETRPRRVVQRSQSFLTQFQISIFYSCPVEEEREKGFDVKIDALGGMKEANSD